MKKHDEGILPCNTSCCHFIPFITALAITSFLVAEALVGKCFKGRLFNSSLLLWVVKRTKFSNVMPLEDVSKHNSTFL